MHPSMTASGKRWALLIGALIAFALPKKIECGFPGGVCQHPGPSKSTCTPYEVEPWGFYLIEHLVGRNVGFAYSSDEDCR
jgi:hypothetical protein